MRLTAAGALTAILATGLLAAAYLLGYPRLAVLAVAGLVALAVSALSVVQRPDLAMTRDVLKLMREAKLDHIPVVVGGYETLGDDNLIERPPRGL